MKSINTIGGFVNRFRYVKGPVFLDGWRYVNRAPFEGDCDDFAWTALVELEGSRFRAFLALVTFRAVIWHVCSLSNKRRGGLRALTGAHAALWHVDHGWIESTIPVFRSKPVNFARRWPHLLPWVAFRVLWGATIGRMF